MSLELQEHGFIRDIFKRVRQNSMYLEEIDQIVAKMRPGAKINPAHFEKIGRKDSVANAIQSDLEIVDLFVRYHVPVPQSTPVV
ncbi:MAG: hypothetical protein ACKO96_09645 [Flammeovirgaceae bacterium]